MVSESTDVLTREPISNLPDAEKVVLDLGKGDPEVVQQRYPAR